MLVHWRLVEAVRYLAIFLLLSLGMICTAFAAVTDQWIVEDGSIPCSLSSCAYTGGSTPVSGWSNYIAKHLSLGGDTCIYGSGSAGSISGVGTDTGSSTVSYTKSCASGTFSNLAVIKCSSGKTLNSSGSCVAACLAAGTYGPNRGVMYSGTGSLPDVLCDGGCAFEKSTGVGLGSSTWGAWQGASVGRACTTGEGTATGAQAGTQCPVGQCLGSLNGTTVCLPCSANPANKVVEKTVTSSTAATANGSGTSTGSTTTTSTTTSTTQNNSTSTSTTTTVETKDGSGAVTGTTTTTTVADRPVDSFCKQNPSASICKTGNVAGSCTAGFSCDGDAVACAIAKDQFTRNCAFFDATTTEKTLYQNILAGTDPLASTLPNPASPTSVSMSSPISQAPMISSSAVTDQTIALGTGPHSLGSVTIPWSQFDWYFVFLGNLAVAFTLVAAAFIVFKQ